MANTGGIKAGKAFVEVYADDSKLRRGLANASRQLKQFGSDVSALGKSMMMAGAAITGPLLAATKHFMTVGDQLDKMALRTGMSTNALSELGFAAEQSGANIEAIEKSVRKMQKTISDASTGEKTYVDALKMVGLTYRQLAGLSPEEQFEAIAKGVNGIADPTMKAAAAVEIFGRAGTQLIPMLGDMRALRAEAQRLGLSIGPEQAKAAAALTDAWNRVKRSVGGVAVAIGTDLAEMLTKNANKITAEIASIRKWVYANSELINSILKWGAATVAIGAGIFALGKAFTILGIAINGARIAMVLFAAHPVVAAAAIIAVGALALAWKAAADEKNRYEGNVARAKPATAGVKAFEKGLQGGSLTDTGKAIADMQANRDRLAEEIAKRRAEKKSLFWSDADVTDYLKDQELELKRADLLLKRFKDMRNDRGIMLGLQEGVRSAAGSAKTGLDTGVQLGNSILAGMKSAFTAAKGKAGIFAPLLAAARGALRNLPLMQDLSRVQAEAINDPQKRDIAQANLEYDKKVAEAGLSGQSVALVEQAREQVIANIRARYAKQDADEKKILADEVLDKEKEIAYQTAEAEILATKTGIDKKRALLDLQQKREREDAIKAGVNPDLLSQKQQFEQQALELGETAKSMSSVRGTFSASEMGTMASGGGPMKKMADATVKLKKVSEDMLLELRRINMEMTA